MLTGDDLTIQLFIGASAVAVLGVAVTQAGWTHKWFVRSLFVIAAVLAFLAIYWKPIRDAHPEIGPVASDVAGSSVSWFTLLLVGFGIVFFLDVLARTGWLRGSQNKQLGAPSPSRSERDREVQGVEPPSERHFITTSADHLMDLCKGQTSMQSDQLANNYKGSWMKVSGRLLNVAGSFGTVLVYISAENHKRVMIHLSEHWRRRAAQLITGQEVALIGEIREISENNLTLNKGEII